MSVGDRPWECARRGGGGEAGAGDPPRHDAPLVVAMVTVGGRWRLSVHTTVAAGSALIVAAIYGSPWVVLLAVVAVIGCARVILGDHTPA